LFFRGADKRTIEDYRGLTVLRSVITDDNDDDDDDDNRWGQITG